tara:strand:- start:516 stop:662 length:147 start_codon:yes stop_codon:yes gene_type:complete
MVDTLKASHLNAAFVNGEAWHHVAYVKLRKFHPPGVTLQLNVSIGPNA